MPSQILTDIDAAVTKATTVQASAAALIRGFRTKMQEAVDAALANGATAEELAPFGDLDDALNTSSSDLEAAVSENTPAANQ